MKLPNRMLSLVFAVTAGTFPVRGAGRGETPGSGPAGQLGKVNFPTSCRAEVQATLERGVALLHSFQYRQARESFAEAEKGDPKCAMAHWGLAMALYHQLWDFPDEKSLKQGRKEIEKARKLGASSEREKGFISAAEAFFQQPAKTTHEARIGAYSTALEHFYAENRGEVEVGAFYGLSLVALAGADPESSADLDRAIAVLGPMLQRFPDHPGVAHYLIHASDRPELANQGLEAARRYAAIAPDSSHALHMPSHIFVRLGFWQDAIDSNLAADRAGAAAARMHMAESHYQTHARDYLSYSYLQSGQEYKARELLGRAGQVVGASEEEKADERAYLAARTALELHLWRQAADLPIPAVRRSWLDTTYWARAIGAARSGDRAGAELALKELSGLVAQREKRSQKEGYGRSTGKAIDLSEAEAWLEFARGNPEEALAELRSAADRQEKSRGESVGIPAREMLADLLLELKRSAEAGSEYRKVLQSSPNRFNALFGAARAAEAAGDSQGAREGYGKLVRICPAGADRPELAEASSALRRMEPSRKAGD